MTTAAAITAQLANVRQMLATLGGASADPLEALAAPVEVAPESEPVN